MRSSRSQATSSRSSQNDATHRRRKKRRITGPDDGDDLVTTDLSPEQLAEYLNNDNGRKLVPPQNPIIKKSVSEIPHGRSSGDSQNSTELCSKIVQDSVGLIPYPEPAPIVLDVDSTSTKPKPQSDSPEISQFRRIISLSLELIAELPSDAYRDLEDNLELWTWEVMLTGVLLRHRASGGLISGSTSTEPEIACQFHRFLNLSLEVVAELSNDAFGDLQEEIEKNWNLASLKAMVTGVLERYREQN